MRRAVGYLSVGLRTSVFAVRDICENGMHAVAGHERRYLRVANGAKPKQGAALGTSAHSSPWVPGGIKPWTLPSNAIIMSVMSCAVMTTFPHDRSPSNSHHVHRHACVSACMHARAAPCALPAYVPCLRVGMPCVSCVHAIERHHHFVPRCAIVMTFAYDCPRWNGRG